MKKSLTILSLSVLIFMLLACGKEPVAKTDQSNPPLQEKEHPPSEDIITPYQYLTLAAGNTSHLSFDYTVEIEGQETIKGNYARSEGKAASNYSVINMYDEAIDIVEILHEDRHYFVLHEFKEVYAYEVPSNHLIYDEMLWAVSGEPTKIDSKKGEVTYFYEHPFIQDESMKHIYAFTMTPQGLTQMVHSLEERHLRTVYFEAFKTDALPDSFYEIPQNYGVTNLDYPFDEGQMPPWWTLKF